MMARPKSDGPEAQSGPPKGQQPWTAAKSQPLPAKREEPVAPSQLSRAQQWQAIMIQRGLPQSHVAQYAKLFDDEEIDLSQLPHLNLRMLVTLGLLSEHALMLISYGK